MADKQEFSWPVRVYWEDTDAGGIVFYANYLKFFERARTEWLRSLGVNQRELRESSGGMFVVVGATLDYQRPARLDDRIEVTACVAELGRASLLLAQQAWLLDGEARAQLLCEGHIRIGWVDSARLKPARIPQDILQVLTP
jgi:acyl-CoA thioester hydrolase